MYNLQDLYQKEIKSKIQKELSINNVMAIPDLVKVVVDAGVGTGATNKEIVDKVREDLAKITGQIPQIRGARVAIAGFGIRRGSPVGLRVTLRGKRMWAFLEKLIKIVLPRIRDFRGIKLSSFDGGGNYSIGIEDYTIFPEISVGKVGKSNGLGITIVTTINNKEWAKRLLEELGMPFEKG